MIEKYIKASECEKYFYEHLDDNGMIGAMNAIDEMPAADVQPVKRGKWSDQMLFNDGFGGCRVGYICSACKKYVPFKGNFCGECGADMRGDNDD